MTSYHFPEIVPGARIAVIRNRSEPHMTVTETKVSKVYKNGNVTLENDPKQQYQVRRYNGLNHDVPTTFYLYATGEGYQSHYLQRMLWNDAVDKEIAEAAVMKRRQQAINNFQLVSNSLIHRNASRSEFDPEQLEKLTEQLKKLLKIEE